MRSLVQIITTPTADTPGTTLLLQFDNKRYLIGSLAEGTQRASIQMGVKLMKVNECFITGRTEWRNTGGVIGMILTLADALSSSKTASTDEQRRKAVIRAKALGLVQGSSEFDAFIDQDSKDIASPQLTFFSPPNLNYQLATARRYVFRNGMPVDVHEIDEKTFGEVDENGIKPYWSDQNIKVWPMSIAPDTRESPRPSNPRKRSFEMVDDDDTAAKATAYERKMLIKGVVNEMFNSTWRLNTLFETRLADVKMPATIFVRNEDTGATEKYTGPMPGGHAELPNPDLEVLVRKPWPGALIESLPPMSPAKEAVSYIIRNHTQRGKFHPDKARALNVPEGHSWAKLAAGQDVQNADGQIITPSQVLGSNRPGGGFAIIDLPDASYIDGLLARPEWKDVNIMTGVGAIVWSCGKGTFEDDRLKNFMQEMPNIKHIISSVDTSDNYIALSSSAAATIRLGEIDSKRYRIPTHNDKTSKLDLSVFPSNVSLAKRGAVIQLEPNVILQTKDIVEPLDVKATIDGFPADVKVEVQQALQKLAGDREGIDAWARTIPGRDVEITTLGTGSALPSKYRNVSATLLRVPGWGSMLFDCGENTLGQLRRAFPAEELEQILADLKVIVISHMHADHHLGIVGVIKAWYGKVHNLQPSTSAVGVQDIMKDRRLAILSEPAMQTWLYEYAAIEDYGYSRIAPVCLSAESYNNRSSQLKWFNPANSNGQDISPALLGLSDVQAVHVKHCAGARAVSLTWPDGFKASYSGDCRPSSAFSRIGKGSTVCIHEATFDDELKGDAIAKNHSTTSEALQVAQAMGAKTCVLTHFSQRYQKLPILEKVENGDVQSITQSVQLNDETEDDDGPVADMTITNGEDLASTINPSSTKAEGVKFKLNTDMKVCVAFDLMRVKVGEIAEMQYFTPALLKLFEEDAEQPEGEIDESKGTNKKKNKSKRRN